MSRSGIWVMVVAVSLVVGAVVWADEQYGMAPPDSPEFARIKGLIGKWEGTSQHGSGEKEPAAVEYKVTSGGSAVVETLYPGTDHEMVSVYHDRNGELMMTHYCMLGNQPELQLTDADDQHLTLSLAGTQGIGSAQEAHMHALSLAWSDPDQLTQTWTSYADGQPKDTAVFKLSRAKSH